jgi:hypothetical protein
MTTFFITATGTDIGKTFVARGLIHHFRRRGRTVEAIKPVVSGFDARNPEKSDPGLLLAALGRPVSSDEIARISPWCFAAPLSPHSAARREDRDIELQAVVACCRAAEGMPADLLFIPSAALSRSTKQSAPSRRLRRPPTSSPCRGYRTACSTIPPSCALPSPFINSSSRAEQAAR